MEIERNQNQGTDRDRDKTGRGRNRPETQRSSRTDLEQGGHGSDEDSRMPLQHRGNWSQDHREQSESDTDRGESAGKKSCSLARHRIT